MPQAGQQLQVSMWGGAWIGGSPRPPRPPALPLDRLPGARQGVAGTGRVDLGDPDGRVPGHAPGDQLRLEEPDENKVCGRRCFLAQTNEDIQSVSREPAACLSSPGAGRAGGVFRCWRPGESSGWSQRPSLRRGMKWLQEDLSQEEGSSAAFSPGPAAPGLPPARSAQPTRRSPWGPSLPC